MNVFHIETALNNRMFDGPTAFLSKNEDDFTEIDRLKFEAMQLDAAKLPRAARREDVSCASPAQYELIAVLRRQDRAGAREDPRKHASSSTRSTSAGRPTS